MSISATTRISLFEHSDAEDFKYDQITGSSNILRTYEEIVVIVPTKRFAQDKLTKAVLGTENKRLVGCINGIADALNFKKSLYQSTIKVRLCVLTQIK